MGRPTGRSPAIQARFDKLSDEQQAVVEEFGKGMAVQAGAGSGKTSTLVVKCLRLLELNPEARFAAVSFTEKSAQDLRVKLSEAIREWSQSELVAEEGAPGESGKEGAVSEARIEPLSRHLVSTIHGLCASIVKEYPEESGFQNEVSVLSENESRLLWSEALEALWSDRLPSEVGAAWERLLESGETKTTLERTFGRLRDLEGFGIQEELARRRGEDRRVVDLLCVFPFLLRKYERQKHRRSRIDFGDLEKGADRALAHAHVQSAFRGRFELLMVDEFQDTNLVQARILWKLARPDLSNLCVVGDPKQSIYRFRDADVTVFEELTAQLPVQRVLTWNFRCRPEVVDYINSVCKPAFDASSMRYEAMIAKRESAAGAQAAQTGVLELELSHPSQLANWILTQNEQGVPSHRMALLLRKIRGNEKWLMGLERAGVRLGISGGGLFWEDPRVLELVALLSAWAFPGDRLNFATFARAPWLGLTDQWLDECLQTEGSHWEFFFKLSHPVASALFQLSQLNEVGALRPGELLAPFFDQPGLATAALGLWHRCEEWSNQGLGFLEVVRSCEDAVSEQRRERDVPPPCQMGLLPVLTLHGSKGLEFEHVILVDFPERAKSGKAPDLFWDRKLGVQLAARDEDGQRDAEAPAEVPWRELERAKDLAESKRLFYVALTRARERLILAKLSKPVDPLVALKVGSDPKSKAKKAPPPAFSQDHWRRWIEEVAPPKSLCLIQGSKVAAPEAKSEKGASVSTAEPEPNDSIHGVSKTRSAKTLRLQRHSVSDWVLGGRCEKALLLKLFPCKPLVAAGGRTDENRAETVPGRMTQAELGTEVHRCLEYEDFEGLEALEKKVGADRIRADVLKRWASTSPLMASAISAGSPEGSSVRVHTEFGFEVNLAGEVLVGSMDRVLRDGTGVTHLIDFKVSNSGDSDEESERTLIRRYRDQMLLYGRALRSLQSVADRPRPLRLWLVWIQARQVREIEVPYVEEELESRTLTLQSIAASVVGRQKASASPSARCAYCATVSSCREGLMHLNVHDQSQTINDH